MNEALALNGQEPLSPAVVEKIVIEGDLAKLEPAERIQYYNSLCHSLNLNPISRPLQYLKLSGKLTLYATKEAAAQLRKMHGISIVKMERHIDNEMGVIEVKVWGKDKHGAEDIEYGVVPIASKGEPFANAILKATTKAKRRLVLSMAGLGFLDRTEVEAIDDAEFVEYEEVEPDPIDSIELPEPKDYSDIIAAIDVEMTRVGWDPKKGRAYLKAQFGNTSRQQLDDSQLRQMLAHLQAIEVTA